MGEIFGKDLGRAGFAEVVFQGGDGIEGEAAQLIADCHMTDFFGLSGNGL